MSSRPSGAGELLAIDVGTSAVKVGLFGQDGRLLRAARRGYPLGRAHAADRIEQDPEDWWIGLREATTEVLSGADPDDLRAVCAGGQAPVLVIAGADGRALRPALSWMDNRAEPQRVRISDRLGEELSGFSRVHRLLWFAENEPDVLDRARWVLEPWDFIGLRLTGGRTAVASTHAGTRLWPEHELKAAGLTGVTLLPPHCDAGTSYGSTGGPWSQELGLPDGVAVVGGMNDAMTSTLGSAITVPGRAADHGGSSGGLIVCSRVPVSRPGIACWPGIVPETSVIGGSFVAGGQAAEWWAGITTDGNVSRLLALAGQAPAGSDRLTFLPFLAGERAPVWDTTARGGFLGATFAHRAPHLARAVIESSGYSLRWLLEAIESEGVPVHDIRVCGRQAGSELWNQIKADITGRAVVVPRVADASLMGGAVLAAAGAGVHSGLTDSAEAMVQTAHVVDPRAGNREVYAELFDMYREAYEALKPLYRRLARLRQPTFATSWEA
jgi:xylulokinase